MYTTEIEKKAMDLLFQYQGRQQRKGTNFPFPVHPMNVYSILRGIGVNDAHTRVVALLHDIIEDTEFLHSDLESLFNKRVADDVQSLTLPDGITGREKTNAIMSKIQDMSVHARIVKAVDRISNIAELQGDDDYPRIKKARYTVDGQMIIETCLFVFDANQKITFEENNLLNMVARFYKSTPLCVENVDRTYFRSVYLNCRD